MHWKKVVAFVESRCKEYTPPSGRTPKNGYARGFVLPSGLQLAIDTSSDAERTNVWIEDCGPPPIPSQCQLYPENKSRKSSLSSVAPRLSGPGYGKRSYRAYKILVKSSQELEALFGWYSSLDGKKQSALVTQEETSVTTETKQYLEGPLNQILYGPPGTGKTFKTAELAVEICDGNAELSGEDLRENLMARYEELRKEGRISFVTFHQSYGYEDFVEGLRPELKEAQVSYRVRPGIFREVCDAARRSTLVKPGLTGKPLKDRTIYKMSLGIAGTSEGKLAFQECIEKEQVLLGYGDDVDFSECKTTDEIRKKVDEQGNFDRPESHVRYVSLFKEEVQVGDIIVVSQGNRAFRAIGEVTGDYEFLEAAAAGSFHQMRPVRWLAVFEGNRAVAEIYDRNFVQSTLYKLDHTGLKLDVIDGLIKGQQGASSQAFVLIIDEINRANISKVFGELITLLEPDKREGEVNAITVKLPYSGDEFCVPSNLHVVGTMNTADRSIALLDTALRRRFEFKELQPDAMLLPKEPVDGVDLPEMLRVMNERIEYLYDRDHTIGHAYFIGVTTLAGLEAVFKRKVIPLLQEYFFENWAKIQAALNDKDGDFIEAIEDVPFGLDSLSDSFDQKPRYRVRRGQFPVSAYVKIYQKPE